MRDYAQVRFGGVVTADAADAALALLEIDELGLDRLDRELLRCICGKFEGGPVGLSTLAASVGEEQDTIEDVYEPYLLQCGLLQAHAARARGDAPRLRAPRAQAARRAMPTASSRVTERDGGAFIRHLRGLLYA